MLLSGRPYGGCAIPLCTNSNRLCAMRLQELSGSSVLLCVFIYPLKVLCPVIVIT